MGGDNAFLSALNAPKGSWQSIKVKEAPVVCNPFPERGRQSSKGHLMDGMRASTLLSPVLEEKS